MPDDPPRVYWDANVFLSFIEGVPDRAPDIETLLEQADQGKLEIITSTISIVEVAFAKQEKQGKALSDDAEERIRKLWIPPSPVKLVEFHAMLAEEAKRLMRASMPQGWSLKPLDAIHLATAKLLGIPEIQTYDKTLDKYAALAGLRIVRPFVEQGQLPLEPPAAKSEEPEGEDGKTETAS